MDYTQAPPVEASSLSSLILIASRPPSNPSSTIQAPAFPLVLYIARVPGSRDVFLTPLKPRDKVVTAEDVQSSLYYVHISCEDDHVASEIYGTTFVDTEVPEPLLREGTDILTETVPPLLPARPHALPPPPPYPVYDQPRNHPDQRLFMQRKLHQIARKPVLSDITNCSSVPSPPSQMDLPEIPRRPLPNLPNESNHSISLHAENLRLLHHSEQTEEANPYLHQYQSQPPKNISNTSYSEPGTLTLIRRNPGSAEQWNVASIHDPPVQEGSSTALLHTSAVRRTKKGGAPLYLDITNPGYAPFAENDRSRSRTSISSDSSAGDQPPEGVFRRRLYMPGSRYGEHEYGRHKFSYSEHGDSSRNNSKDKRWSIRGNGPHDHITANSTAPSFDRRTKGYAFTSPWDGHCEFSTGATGKSLKCHHVLSHSSSAEVSELRFNLPTKMQPTPPADKRSSYFSQQRHRSVVEWEGGTDAPILMIGEDGRIDRSLGQEKAGGGFGGKQAKLGKLIIMPEGFNMLDLLVAANIGLWWRAYERL